MPKPATRSLCVRRRSALWKSSQCLACGMVTAVVSFFSSQPVRAANDAWSTAPASGNFSGVNWTTGVTVPGAPTGTVASTDSLFFGASGITALNNDDTGFSFNGFTFIAGASAFTIGGNTFVLTGGMTNNSANIQTFTGPFTMTANRTFTTTAGGGNIVLGGNISGAAGSITAAGSGTLTLSGADTYTGGTNVSAGATLALTGSLTNASTLTVNTGGTFTEGAAGVLGGGASLTVAGGSATISGANTYTGATRVNGGSLTLDFSQSATPATATNIVTSTSALTLGINTLASTLNIKGGGAGATNSQAFGSTAFSANSANNLAVNQNGATTLNVTLGGLTRGGGSTVDFTLPTSGTVTSTTTTATGTNKINGNGVAYSTVGATTWLTNNAGTLGALAAGSYQVDTFAASGDTDITMADAPAAFTINTLRFNAPGNTLTLNSSGTSTVTAGGILVTSAGTGSAIASGGAGAGLTAGGTGREVIVHDYSTLNIGAPITGTTVGLTLSGTGTTTLSGANTYTGATSVTSGTTVLSGSLTNTAITVYGTSAFNETNAGTIGGTSSLTFAGTATATLAGANGYTGTTTVPSGTLILSNAGAIGSSALTISGGTVALRGDTSTAFADASTTFTSGTINVDQVSAAAAGTTLSLGPITLTGNSTLNTTGANGVGLALGAVTNNGTGAGTTTVTNAIAAPGVLTVASYAQTDAFAHTLAFNGAGNTTVTGPIIQNGANALSVTYGGAGTLTMSSGASTFTGASVTTASNAAVVSMTLNSGTLALGADSTVAGGVVTQGPLGTGALLISGGAVQALTGGGARTIANPVRLSGSSAITGSTDLNFTGGVSNLSNSAATMTVNNTGVTRFSGTTPFNLRADGTAAGARTFTAAGSGTIQISAPVTSGTNDGSAFATTLAYTGTGTLALSGANTYAGPTTVSAGGTLLVNGTQGSTGTASTAVPTTYTVNGTLGGTGTINTNATSKTVTINAGGAVAPGDSTQATAAQTGILSVVAPVAFNSTAGSASTLAIQVGGNTAGNGAGRYDQLSVTGALTLGTNVVLTLSVVNGYSPTPTDALYVLVHDGAAALNNTFVGEPEGSTVTLAPGMTGMITYLANWTGTEATSTLTGGNDVAIYNIAVPEPSALVASVIFAGAIGFCVRRRELARRVG